MFRCLCISLSLILAVLGNTCAAGKKYAVDSGKITIEISGDPLIEADTASCIIPFTRVEKLILIKGRADSTEGNFIFDTGAPGLVLNVSYFRAYPVEETNEECPQCHKGNLVVRTGKFGKFLSCSTFPDCNFTKPFVKETNSIPFLKHYLMRSVNSMPEPMRLSAGHLNTRLRH